MGKSNYLLERHLDDVKSWMRESKINPESKFGKEFLKQTRLLFEHDERLREIERETTEKQLFIWDE
jgi:hypothetical protein